MSKRYTYISVNHKTLQAVLHTYLPLYSLSRAFSFSEVSALTLSKFRHLTRKYKIEISVFEFRLGFFNLEGQESHKCS